MIPIYKHQRKILWTAVILAVIVGSLYFLSTRQDPMIQKYMEVESRMKDTSLPAKERLALTKEYLTLPNEMTDDQRHVLLEKSRTDWEKQESDRLKSQIEKAVHYHQLAPVDRIKYLDETVNWEKSFLERVVPSSFQNKRMGLGGGKVSEIKGKTASDENKTKTRPPVRFRPTEELREEVRKKQLDASTAEQRAMYNNYLRDLDARRVERGLPSMKERGTEGLVINGAIRVDWKKDTVDPVPR